MRDELPKIFSVNSEGLVVARNRLRTMDEKQGEVIKDTAKGSSQRYSVIFTNQGEKAKSNPNRINFEVSKSERVFDRCLVSSCRNPRSKKGNIRGLCKGNQHKHLEVIEKRKDLPDGTYYARRNDENGHLVTGPPLTVSQAEDLLNSLKTKLRERRERKKKSGKDERDEKNPRLWGPSELKKLDHYVDWVGVLREDGSGREIFAPWHGGIAEVLLTWIGADEERGKKVDEFVGDVLQNVVVGHIKDSTTMQIEYERGLGETETGCKGLGALDVISSVRSVVNKHFDDTNEGISWKVEDREPFEQVPIRIVAAMMALGFAAEEANRSDAWFCKEILGGEKSHYASAYMSAVYYLLRRAKASQPQATMVVQAMTR